LGQAHARPEPRFPPDVAVRTQLRWSSALIARSHQDLEHIRRNVTRLRKLSDRLVKVGPFGFGLDGLLSFLPVAGVIYSAGAGGLLLLQGVRARASWHVLARMGGLLVVNTLLDVPGGTPLGIFSGVADTFFTAHKWAAGLLLKHMDETLYVEGVPGQPSASPDHARPRGGADKRRVVFLR